jgi:imidazolonepropionase
LTSQTVTGIGELVTNDPELAGPLGIVRDAAVVIEEGRVVWTGPSSAAPAADTSYDAGGRAVTPGFVDSHAHLVFAGDRAEEFALRMSGTPYNGGGIHSTVAATRAATDDELAANLACLVAEMRRQGTTTLEVKSGYGLTVHDESRSLALAREVTSETIYLGAHVVASEYADDPAGYVDLVTGPMLDACAPLARWVDVFCEKGAFGAEAAGQVLRAGASRGLMPRVHANQLGHGPGIELACEVGAAAADHCTYATDADLAALADAGVVATLLPAVEFSTRSPYPDGNASWPQGSRWRWQPTATRARATAARCRCASRSRSGRCG